MTECFAFVRGDITALVASIVAVVNLLSGDDFPGRDELEEIPRLVWLEGEGVQFPGIVAVVGQIVLVPSMCPRREKTPASMRPVPFRRRRRRSIPRSTGPRTSSATSPRREEVPRGPGPPPPKIA